VIGAVATAQAFAWATAKASAEKFGKTTLRLCRIMFDGPSGERRVLPAYTVGDRSE
jgi:hypothetical protein